MIPPGKIEQYRKILALRDRAATDGERHAAQARLDALEQRFPGIGYLAMLPNAPSGVGPGRFGGSPPPRRSTSGAYRTGQRATQSPTYGAYQGNGEGVAPPSWLHLAQEAVGIISEAVGGFSRAQQLRAMVDSGMAVRSRFNRRGALLITVEIPAQLLRQVLDAVEEDPDGREVLAGIIGDGAGEEFLDAVGSTEGATG